jgi:hypothetical protein
MARRLTAEERTIANALLYALQTVGAPLAQRWADEGGYEDFQDYQRVFKEQLLALVPVAENIKLTASPFTARCSVAGKAARVTFKFQGA